MSADPREIRALGYRFHPMRKSELLDFLFAVRAPDVRVVLGSANLHGLHMFERVAEYRNLMSRPCVKVIVDGMPVIWMLRLLGQPVESAHRTTWADWFEDALARAAREGKRVYVLGHRPDVVEAGLRKAHRMWPDLMIQGRDGYFDLGDYAACHAVVDGIREMRPDILFVGMSMPRQEIFVQRYLSELDVPLVGLGGAAFAYFAGDQTTPPRWMGAAGLEWAFRLIRDPRRLAGRYLVEPFALALALATRLARERLGLSGLQPAEARNLNHHAGDQ